ncbi:alpha/beta hydrolase [Williamsia phyllosphaerae]|uniref:alpha/beta hydrolase n=1 Tax=Williamsia phyllosphaerae TaxID=885042 RepID=UPI001663FED8|nr:alpha/beta hydrolase family protein [Williamsia phyllosphaerae]
MLNSRVRARPGSVARSRPRSTRRRVLPTLLALGIVASVVTVAPHAAAAPAPAPVAKLDKVVKVNSRHLDVTVDSPAMRGKVTVSVLLPRDTNVSRSTVYMLDGAGATGQVSDWLTKGNAAKFFADKNVNVVLPSGGAGSFYTNWQKNDPKLGMPQWETFLTEELPPLIDGNYNGNGRNAIVGLSMGGQAALALTFRHPNLYTGAASLSGCPPVSGLLNEAYVRATVAKDGGDADNMWGRVGGPDWAAHDPSLHLDQLRGKNLYISAGSGAIGPLDFTTPLDPGMSRPATLLAASGLESGAYRCSLEFALTLRANGVAADVSFPLIGTHSWAYWSRDLPLLWPTISRGL